MDDIVLKRKKIALTVSIAEEMLKNGAEVYRVEDTVKRILIYYGYADMNVYIVSNGIFVTVDEQGDNPVSSVRNVPSWSMNLGKIAELNKLSREICQGKCSMENAECRLNWIKEVKLKSNYSQMMATGVGSAAFCFLFGGRIVEMLFAFIIGVSLSFFMHHTDKRRVSKFIVHIIGSMLVCIIAVTAGKIVESIAGNIYEDKVIIGSIMIMVPGVALTTSIRDFFSGDYLSGSIHLIDALLTAVCIAAGVGIAMKAFMVMGWV